MPSTLYITEYATAQPVRAGQMLAAACDPPLAEQAITTSGTSAQSAPLNAKTRFVRLAAGLAGISVAAGDNPTAATTNRRMAAGMVEYFTVDPESVAASFRYAAIDNA